jgi:hypothetical protein
MGLDRETSVSKTMEISPLAGGMGGLRYASVEDGTIELVKAAHTDDRRIILWSSPKIEEGDQARIPGSDGVKRH